MSERTRTVRVLVVMNSRGEWDSRGWGGDREDEEPSFLRKEVDDGVAGDWVDEGLGVRRFWITAELPIPADPEGEPEVAAEVEES